MRGCLVWVIIALILCSPVIFWIVWGTQSVKPVSLLVIDKSVLDMERTSHAGLFYMLAHGKYRHANGKPYSADQDYYGFFPLDKQGNYMVRKLTGLAEEDVDSIYNQSQAMMIVDARGVRHDRWVRGRTNDETSPFLDGGLNEADINLITRMREHGKPVIIESMAFSPAQTFEDRQWEESVLGVEWSGWQCFCFNELAVDINVDIPHRWVQRYEEQNGTGWRFKGPGIVMVNDIEEVHVLATGTDIVQPYPTIRTDASIGAQYKLPDRVPYFGSFEIVYPKEPDMRVVSRFEMNLTPRGDSLFNELKLPKSFPAVITGQKVTFIAGDFSNVQVPEWTTQVDQADKIMLFLRRFAGKPDPHDAGRFFWTYTYPLMTKVLRDNL
jgi:hypothetical protein